jgi:hypothetical protein
MMNDELFCTYEQAVELRKLGFNEPCFRFQYVCDKPQKESSIKDLENKDFIGIPTEMQALGFLTKNFDVGYSRACDDISTIIDIFIELAQKQQQ